MSAELGARPPVPVQLTRTREVAPYGGVWTFQTPATPTSGHWTSYRTVNGTKLPPTHERVSRLDEPGSPGVACDARHDSTRGADMRSSPLVPKSVRLNRRLEVVMTTSFQRIARPVAAGVTTATLTVGPGWRVPRVRLIRECPKQSCLFRRRDDRSARPRHRIGRIDDVPWQGASRRFGQRVWILALVLVAALGAGRGRRREGRALALVLAVPAPR
jgi:hypothetical protein